MTDNPPKARAPRPRKASTELVFAPKSEATQRLGEHIRARRDARGLTLKQVSASYGCAVNVWRKFESGAMAPAADDLIRVAEIIGADPTEMIKIVAGEG